MDEETKASLQVIWEQLNGAWDDIDKGDLDAATTTIEDCINRLEKLGVGV